MKRKSLREFLTERRIRRAFEKIVSPENIEELLRKDPSEIAPLRQGPIEYVLTFVRAENASETGERMGQVVDLAIKHGGTVHDVVSGLVIVAFGTPPRPSGEAGNRLTLVDALQREFASHIKIVHGAAEGLSGLLGSKERISYSFVVPKFDQVLGALGRLRFGETEEFRR